MNESALQLTRLRRAAERGDLDRPRAVVNVAAGVVAQMLMYDEFGVVLTDTNPCFIPFGFAGGNYDSATNLVRFGAKDYEPRVGRWTTKEPLGFAGGLNFYAYAGNDPINFVEPDGLKTYPFMFEQSSVSVRASIESRAIRHARL